MTDLFASASKKPATTKKADDKINVVLSETKYAGIGEKAKKLMELRAESKSITAEVKMKEDDLSQIARAEYINLYKKEQRNVGTFVAVCENGVKFNITPADAYGKVDEDRAKIITEKYGEGVVSSSKVYSFNPDVLQRNMEAISKAIMSCPEISDDDKANLLTATETFSVQKGLIDKLVTFGDKMVDLFNDVKPTLQIKF